MLPVRIASAIALTISFGAFAVVLWRRYNHIGFRIRGQHRAVGSNAQTRRQMDLGKMSRADRRVFKQAKKLVIDGHPQRGAQLLESIKMQREAIATLEATGHIHDAAAILLRMQRPNRAGVIYARHKKWKDAGKCFKAANMPAESAKSYREAGEHKLAAEMFLAAGSTSDAAACLYDASAFRESARAYAGAGNLARFVDCMQRLGPQIISINFEPAEMTLVVEAVRNGNVDPIVLNIAAKSSKLVEMIKSLLTRSQMQPAIDLYSKKQSDIGPQLMSEVNYADHSAENLAVLFSKSNAPGYAGMVFERMNSFERAAEMFLKGGDQERARFCFERAGKLERISELTTVAPADKTSAVSDAKRPVPTTPVRFSLMDATSPDLAKPLEVKQSQSIPAVQVSAPPPVLASSDPHTAFHGCQLFADLESSQKDAMFAIGEHRVFEIDEVIIDYHEIPKGVYVIVAGSVRCLRTSNSKEIEIGALSTCDSFGELWLLSELPASIRFVAVSQTQIHMVPRTMFLELMEKNPTVARKLYKRFTQVLLTKLVSTENHWHFIKAA